MLTTLVTKINEPQQRQTKVGMQNKTEAIEKRIWQGPSIISYVITSRQPVSQKSMWDARMRRNWPSI